MFEHPGRQVKTTGIPAEFGGALGGVISAVTKSGGNIFTGETHYYLDGASLSAGPAEPPCAEPDRRGAVQHRQDTKQPDVRQEFGDRSAVRSCATNCSSSDRSRRASTFARTRAKSTNGTEEGDIERTSKFIQAFGKISVSSRRVNAYVSTLVTPTYVTGTLPPTTASAPISSPA